MYEIIKDTQLMSTGSSKNVYMNIVLNSGVPLKQDMYLAVIIIQFPTRKLCDNFKRNLITLMNILVILS